MFQVASQILVKSFKWFKQILNKCNTQQYIIKFRVFLLIMINGIYEITILGLNQKQQSDLLLHVILIASQAIFILISLVYLLSNQRLPFQILTEHLLLLGSLEYCIQVIDLRNLHTQTSIFLSLYYLFIKDHSFKQQIMFQIITIFYLSLRTMFFNLLADYLAPIIISIILCRFTKKAQVEMKGQKNLSEIYKDYKNFDQIQNNMTNSVIFQQNNEIDLRNPNCSRVVINKSYLNNENLQLCITNLEPMEKSVGFVHKTIQNMPNKIDQIQNKFEDEILKNIKTGIILIDSNMKISYCNNNIQKRFETSNLNVLFERLINIKLKSNYNSQLGQSHQTTIKKNNGKSKFDQEKKQNSLKKTESTISKMSSFKKEYSEKQHKIQSRNLIHQDSRQINELTQQFSLSLGQSNSTFNKLKSMGGGEFDCSISQIIRNYKRVQSKFDNTKKKQIILKKYQTQSERLIQTFKTSPNLDKRVIQNQHHIEEEKKQNLLKPENKNYQINSAYYANKGRRISKNDQKSQNNIKNLNLKQSIIPFQVLKIFQNEEVRLEDLLEQLFQQKEKVFQQNFWSHDDLDNKNSRYSQNKNQSQNDEETSKEDIIYFIENNNLIINFKLNPNDAHFTGLRIGFYLQREKKEQQYFHIQEKFILIEYFDSNILQTNINEKDIFEYKNKMLASVSHELRTPLNCSIQMLQMLLNRYEENQKDEKDEELKETLLKPALQSNQLLLHIINDILDYGQINAGMFQLVFEPLSILNVVTECADLIYFQTTLKGLTLELIFDSNLPEVIHSDANRIRQVLLNLLSNALKFTDKGCINITVSLETNEIIRVEVQDTGCGIPSKSLQKHFETFGNYSSKYHVNTTGAGLGMSIANNLAQGLGGNRQMEVKSEVGVGTTFAFFIINRAVNKKGCQYKLKDVFNRRVVKWETITKVEQNVCNQIQSSRQFINSMFKGIRSSINYDQQESSKGLIGESQQLQQIHDSKLKQSENLNKGNIALTNNIMQNIISVKMRPSQHLIEAARPKSGRSITLVPQSNHSIFESRSKFLGYNSPTVEFQSLPINDLVYTEFTNDYNLEKTEQNTSSLFQEQYNNTKTINNTSTIESCQILEDSYQNNYFFKIVDNQYKSQVKYFSNSNKLKHEFTQDILLSFSEDNSDQISEQPHHQFQDTQKGYPESNFSYFNKTNSQEQKQDSFSSFKKGKKQDQKIESNQQQQQQQQIQQQQYLPSRRTSISTQQLETKKALKYINTIRSCKCSQILIVDDNDFNLYTLEMILKMYGFIVDKANSGFQAIDMVQQRFYTNICCNHYPLIFMDIDMPLKDGHETTKEILDFFKQKQINPSVISACSAFVQENEKRKATLSGMSYYITKPIDIQQMESVLFKIFSHNY